MKRILSVLALVLGILLLISCASKKPITTQEEADTAFQKVYQKFKGDIILEGEEQYTVKSGDTLTKIAHEKYKNGYYFPLIMLASSDVVLDPDKINVGDKLTIPVLQSNLDDAKAKGKIKNFLGEIASVYDRREGRAPDAQHLRDLAATL